MCVVSKYTCRKLASTWFFNNSEVFEDYSDIPRYSHVTGFCLRNDKIRIIGSESRCRYWVFFKRCKIKMNPE